MQPTGVFVRIWRDDLAREPKEAAMKTLLLSLAMLSTVVLAWQFGPSYAGWQFGAPRAVGHLPAPGAAPQIDFARLHAEARHAMERLREKQMMRLSLNERRAHPRYAVR